MSTETRSELQAFHEWVGGLVRAGSDLTPEECAEMWRDVQENMDESVAAIKEGLEQMERGECRPMDEALAEIRNRIESRREQ